MAKLVFFFLLAFLAGFLVGLKLQMSWQKSQAVLRINDRLIQIELAKTEEKIARGLSGREKLEENQGMLFVFERKGAYPFWMKEMKFNLDFVFLDNEIVVDLVENVPYPKDGEQPQIVIAKKDFDRVLEINAGTVKRLGVKIGDTMRITDSEISEAFLRISSE